MSHSDSLADSKEFEEYLEKYKLDKKLKNIFDTKNESNTAQNQNKNPDISEESQTNTSDTPIGEKIINTIDKWLAKNPGPTLAIVFGGSAFICYKMTIGILSQAVFKGNLKTSRYFDKHAG